MPNLLLTGSTGFVGRAVLRRFADLGWTVMGIGRRPNDSPSYLSHDLRHPLPASMDFKPDAVVHAAALSSPWGSRRAFREHNVTATQHVIDYCRRNGCPRFVYISSSSVYYQACDQFDLSESMPVAQHPINRYAASKIEAEKVVATYEGEHVILRPRAVFGPDDTVLFPRILRAARAGRLPLLYRDGEAAVGDLIYIDNLVDYIATVVTNRDVKGTFNLTNNEPVPIAAFLLSVFEQLGVRPPRKRVNVKTAMRLARVLEMFHGVFLPWIEPPITRFGVHVFAYSKTFDVRRAVEILGAPQVSNAEGAKRFVDWVKREQPY